MSGKKLKVAVQAPRGPSFDLGDDSYALEREALDPIGAEIVEIDADSTEAFVEGAKDAQAVIARFRRIHEGIIQGLESCLVIGCGSVGTDTVDVDAATEAGIVVTNVPDVFIEEVADHAMMLILAAARRLVEMDRMSREGEWADGRPTFVDIPRLWGQTLGLVSFGNVARAVARRARPFGVRVVAYDPYVSELEMTAEGVEPVSLAELLERSDIVSLHAPLNEETHHMLGAESFAAMKRSALFVNTGRGPCVDEAALIEALEQGEIAGAALDVLEVEPPAPDNPPAGAPRRHPDAAHRLGDLSHDARDAAASRTRAGDRAAGPLAPQLRQPARAAACAAAPLAARLDAERAEPMRARAVTTITLAAACAAASSRGEEMKKEYLDPQQGFTQVVTAELGGVKTIWVSGQVGVSPETGEPGADLKEQATFAFGHVLKRLESAGASIDDVVKTTVYIKDIDPDKVRTAGGAQAAVFGVERYPASTWVGVTGLVFPAYLIEVEATAVVAPRLIRGLPSGVAAPTRWAVVRSPGPLARCR